MSTEALVSEAEDIVPEAGGVTRRKARGIVAQRLIDNLSLAERLTDVAKKPKYAETMAGYGLDSAFIARLSQNTTDCRAGIATLADQRGNKSSATGSESSKRTTFLNGLQEAQTLAKLRLTLHPDETALQARYQIGTSLRTLSRASLESAADQIIAHLKTDLLPGFDASKIAALEATRAAWRSADRTQGSAQSSAITTRQQLLDRFAEVEKQRRALQLAADAAYPYTNSNNAGVRGEFALPKNAPMKKT